MTTDRHMIESSTARANQQLIRELRQRVRDLEAQNTLLWQALASAVEPLRDVLSADFTPGDRKPD